jgi:transposase-like protein
MARFTTERRERFLTLLETGRNVEEVAADVDVNPSTVSRWAARGREGTTKDARAFAERLTRSVAAAAAG